MLSKTTTPSSHPDFIEGDFECNWEGNFPGEIYSTLEITDIEGGIFRFKVDNRVLSDVIWGEAFQALRWFTNRIDLITLENRPNKSVVTFNTSNKDELYYQKYARHVFLFIQKYYDIDKEIARVVVAKDHRSISF